MALGWGRGLRDQRGAEPGAPGRLRALGRALFPVWKGSDGDEKGVGGPTAPKCGRVRPERRGVRRGVREEAGAAPGVWPPPMWGVGRCGAPRS